VRLSELWFCLSDERPERKSTRPAPAQAELEELAEGIRQEGHTVEVAPIDGSFQRTGCPAPTGRTWSRPEGGRPNILLDEDDRCALIDVGEFLWTKGAPQGLGSTSLEPHLAPGLAPRF
jgi:hypothetical protein